MKSRATLLAMMLVIFALCVSPALGQITYVNRDTYYSFGIPNTNNFAGTTGFYDNYINLQAQNIGDSTSNLWGIKSLAQGFNWVMLQGNYSLNYSLTSPNQYTGNFAAVNGLTDTMEISYGFPVGADFNQSYMTTGSSNGHYVLNFSGGGSNGVTNGFPFFLTLNIPGDWSTQGTAQGDHNFISLNPNWTITQDFTYNGLNTVFQAQEPNYQGDNPGLQFQLYGAPVPEPSSLILLGSGVLGLAGLIRRKLSV